MRHGSLQGYQPHQALGHGMGICSWVHFQMAFFPLLGESGLGKSTLIQSLFLTNFFGNKSSPPAIGKCAASLVGREDACAHGITKYNLAKVYFGQA